MSKEEILAHGGFRVDRKRALEKMERFQLADPVAYVVELVAAATLAGARTITVTSDADDLIVHWEGEVPTRAELDGIFDGLFGAPRTPRGGLLQHLAMGVLGALRQSPRFVRLDRGPLDGEPSLRLTVVDPSETLAEEVAHGGAGITVHVRRKMSLAVLGRVFTGLVREAPEARLVRRCAVWCPAEVVVNERKVEPPPSVARVPAAPGGSLWLVEGEGGVDLVRHGVIVGAHSVVIGGLSVAGWVREDTLELDASRASVIDNAALAAVHARLEEAVAELLMRFVPVSPAGDDAARAATATPKRDDLLQAALWLSARKRPLGPYAALPLLEDVQWRAWSLDAVNAYAGAKGYSAERLPDDPTVLVFVKGPHLAALLPDLPDLTEELRARREGRARREAAQLRRAEPEFPGTQRRLTAGTLRGAVRWRTGENPTILVLFWIGGAEVEQVHVPSPAGPMEAILDNPAFGVDTGWSHVVDDAVRREAIDVLNREAMAFAAEHMLRVSRGALPIPPPAEVLSAAVRALSGKERANLPELLAKRTDHLVFRAPALRGGDGAWRSLERLLAGPGPQSGTALEPREPWILLEHLPVGCPPDIAMRVVLCPAVDIPAWAGWLRPGAVDGRSTLEDDIRGARRRAATPRKASLPKGENPHVSVSAGGWSGELGLGPRSWLSAAIGGTAGVDAAAVELLRAGIPVATVPLDLGMPGLVAVLDRPDAQVNRAHDGLLDTRDLERLREALRPYVEGLAQALWVASPAARDRALPDAVLRWLIARAAELPAWALDRPLVVGEDGKAWTVRELRARDGRKNTARIKLLSRPPPAGLPGFEDALVVGTTVRAALIALCGKATRDAEEDVAGGRRSLDTYLAGPPAAPPCALHTARESHDGVEVDVFLPSDPEQIGVLRIEALWSERLLSTWNRGEALGPLVRLSGGEVVPAPSMSMLRDPNVMSRWSRKARLRLAQVVHAALDARGDKVPSSERTAWRALLARLDGASDRSRGEDAARDRLSKLPLFTRLDGAEVSRDTIAAASGVRHVPPSTAPGPTDSPWYILEEAWVLRALAGVAVTPGTELLVWREGERRREALVRREPIIRATHLLKAPVTRAGLVGEVALVSHGPDGLRVTPLADGLPLEPLALPFPAPAVAVVGGVAVRPDRAFRVWDPSPEAAAAHAALLTTAHSLAATLAASPAADRPEAVDRWVARYALGHPGAAALPVFALLGGGRASVADLQGRKRVGVLAPGRLEGPFVAGPQPVVAPPWLVEALGERFAVADLGFVADRHAHRRREGRRGAAALADLRWSEGGAVEVLRDGVLLATLPADGEGGQGAIVPLRGWIHAEVEVDGTWVGLVPEGLAAVRAALDAHARALVAREVAAAPPGVLIGPGLASPLIGALTRLVDLAGPGAAELLSVPSPQGSADPGGRPNDPLLVALAELPLWRDVAGRPGGLVDLLADASVRCVDPGMTGEAGADRIWQVSGRDRALIARFRPVVDATDALRDLTVGAMRRAAARGPRPTCPSGAHAIELACASPALQGQLWLGGPEIELRVDGARIGAWPMGVAGVGGWVEGDFSADPRFEEARVPAAVKAQVRVGMARLLQHEGDLDPQRLLARISTAVAARRDSSALLEDPDVDWGLVAPFVDALGAPLTLRQLVNLRLAGTLLVGPEGARPPKKGQRVVVGGATTMAALSAWFPGARVLHIDELATQAESKKKTDAEKRLRTTRTRRVKAMVEAAERLYRRWSSVSPAPPGVEALVSAWAADGVPGWPAFDSVDAEGPWPAVVAFAVGAAVENAAVRLACAQGVAEALEG